MLSGFRCDAQLVVERVVPGFLHVVPVRDDAVFDGYFRVRMPRLDWASSLLRSGVRSRNGTRDMGRYVPHIRVLLAHADHYALVTGATDDRTK